MKPRPVTYKDNIATITYRGETLVNVLASAKAVLRGQRADQTDAIAMAAGYEHLLEECDRLRAALQRIADNDPFKQSSAGIDARHALLPPVGLGPTGEDMGMRAELKEMITPPAQVDNYRIYMSIRSADTGEQLGAVTIMRHVEGCALAESYVEGFNNRDNRPPHINLIVGGVGIQNKNVKLLVVYMKELIK